SPAVLCSVIVRKNLELFHRVRIGIHHGIVAEEVIVVDAVNQKRQRFGALPADRKRISGPVVGIGREDARLQQAELKRVAFDQRQIHDAALGLDRTEGCGDGVNLGHISRDFHYFGLGADLQRDVLFGSLVDLENDSILNVFAEAGALNHQSVLAHGNKRERILTVVSALRRFRNVGLRVGQRNGSAGHDSSRSIPYGSQQRSGNFGGKRRRSEQQTCQYKRQTTPCNPASSHEKLPRLESQ